MINPINYSAYLDNESPLQAAAKSAQFVSAFQQDAFKQRAQEAELLKMQQEALRQQVMQADLTSLSQKKDQSGQDYERLLIKYPQLVPNLKEIYANSLQKDQQSALRGAQEIQAALLSQRPDIAKQRMDVIVESYRASGDEKTAAYMERMGKIIEEDPANAKIVGGMVLTSMIGADEYNKTYKNYVDAQSKLESMPFDTEKARQDAKTAKNKAIVSEEEAKNIQTKIGLDNQTAELNAQNISSSILDREETRKISEAKYQLSAEQFRTDLIEKAKKAQQESEKGLVLSPWSEKLVNDLAVKASSDKAEHDRLTDIATRLQNAAEQSAQGGVVTRGLEVLKRQLGGQDALSLLRTEATAFINKEVITMLAQGPATDKDVALALKGAPPDDADAAYLASYLNGRAKLRLAESKFNESKINWISQVGSLRNAQSDLEIDGALVRKGTNYMDYMRSKFKGQPVATQQKQARSYEKYGAK